MVKASLKKVFIKNFKSLHDCEIDIGKMNVVVGANASGKSNLIEAFRLLKKIYIEKDPFPFLEWWGYENVVWQRKEELPIIIGLLFDIEGYDIYFETNFTGAGGKFQILREIFEIKGYVKVEKEGEWIAAKNDADFIENIIKNSNKYEIRHGGKIRLKKEKNQYIQNRKIRLDSDQNLLEYSISENIIWVSTEIIEKSTGKKFGNFILAQKLIGQWNKQSDAKPEQIKILCPSFGYKEYFPPESLYDTFISASLCQIAASTIYYIINKMSILYPLNIRLMKIPQPFRREEILKEDGSSLASVFHSIYLKEGKIPEEIYNPLSLVFPKIDVRPHITDDGRVMIKFFEDGFGLLPPNTSDGIYKILTVLIAIYLKPPLLIVDEIENSLHPETLALILDTIKASDIQAIITTHSPVVVDMTEPDDMVLVEKEQGESRFKRIKDPDKLRDFLKEKGITFSTGWLYGEISQIE